jgi:hypothetical protein
MAIRTVQDLMKTQQELLERMRKQTDAAAEGGRRVLTGVRQEKERELAHLKERLAETEEAKAETLARYDRQIKAQREAIARLEQELLEMDKHEKQKPGPGGGANPGKARAAARRRR